ncbi:MAG: UDP-glucuronic acid decarboxylase family protein [archaeon]
MERVLVAGGAGFIGSWICEKLSKKYEVICVDNLCTGRKKNIEHIQNNFNFLQQDITKLFDLDEKLNFVLHMASPASPKDYQNMPIETLLANSVGTLNLLEIARKNNARFLFTSTSEVYGNPLQHPQTEEYFGNVNPNGIRSMYDESKRFGEALCMAYMRKYNIDLRIARIFNTYGPRMQRDDGRVVSNFINQALGGKEITIYGDGKQTRSCCYVSDMVEGLMKLMFTSNLKGKVINLGNPDERTIVDLAKKVLELLHSESQLSFKNLPADDPERRCPDITKAKKYLEWQPTISLEQGLKETIEYYRKED